MVPSSLCEKGRHTAQSIPLRQRELVRSVRELGRCWRWYATRVHHLFPEQGWGGGESRQRGLRGVLTPREGVLAPPNPPRSHQGRTKPPLDAVARFAWHKGACPAPSLVFPIGSSRPTARRVRLDKWEKTGRIKAAVPHGSGRREVAPRRCQTKKH